MIRLALYQPEIPQNVGTLMRLGACVGAGIDIIEPCGFPLSDKRMQRAGMDYMQHVDWQRHADWNHFLEDVGLKKIVAVDVKAPTSHIAFQFHLDDYLLLGQEGKGLPDTIFNAVPRRVAIPMLPGRRSLNVAVAGAMVLTEALRQTQQFPDLQK